MKRFEPVLFQQTQLEVEEVVQLHPSVQILILMVELNLAELYTMVGMLVFQWRCNHRVELYHHSHYFFEHRLASQMRTMFEVQRQNYGHQEPVLMFASDSNAPEVGQKNSVAAEIDCNLQNHVGLEELFYFPS